MKSSGLPKAPERILIRGVNWLGDAVMTTPALIQLRRAFPEATVTLLSPEKLGELWWKHPAVDEVLLFSAKEKITSIARQIRRGNYDLGVVLPNSPRSAIELWLGSVSYRIGYRARWRSAFLSRSIPTRPDHLEMVKRSPQQIRSLIAAPTPVSAQAVPSTAHHIHHYLHLVAQLGASAEPIAPELGVTDVEVRSFHDRFLAGAVPGDALVLGLNAGAEYGPAKRWPEDRFVEAAATLSAELGCHWVVFGGRADEPLAGRIAHQIRHRLQESGRSVTVTSVAGQTGLRQLMAGLKRCRLLITNDTGPMHVAAAVGTPVVVPFGSTSPELTGPGLPGETRHRLIVSPAVCRPCFLRECPIDFRCMQEITASRVIEAVRQLVRG